MIPNEKNNLLPIRPITGWKVSMDFHKLNSWTEKDHFPMPFIGQMLNWSNGCGWNFFLDGDSGYNQIYISLEDQEKMNLHSLMGPLP